MKTEYLGEFHDPFRDPQFRAAVRAWLTYYLGTENFDRSLPGVWSPREPDSWLPYPEFRARSSKYAVQALKDLHESVRDVPPGICVRARDYAGGLSYAAQEALFQQLNTTAIGTVS